MLSSYEKLPTLEKSILQILSIAYHQLNQTRLKPIPVNEIINFNISKLGSDAQAVFEMTALLFKIEKYGRIPLKLYVAPILSLKAQSYVKPTNFLIH